MADPRNNLFSVKPCPAGTANSSLATISGMTSERVQFFNSVGKIGDIEAMNDIGAGRISQGMRVLSSVSNSIRMGCGSLPSSIGRTLDSGANWVLDNIGIAQPVIDAISQFSPAMANQAYGQARRIFENVQAGNFNITDIPFYLQDFTNLEMLGRRIFTPGMYEQTTLQERCEASPYAMDLISRAPKYKFMYVVQFVFNSPYDTILDSKNFAFVVKTSTRPNISYQMEDVNFYNYRSKFITKAQFEDMEMTFHDDTQNYSAEFYAAYLKAMSPIANLQTTSELQMASSFMDDSVDGTIRTTTVNTDTGETSTVAQNLAAYNVEGLNVKGYAASSGPLLQQNISLIKHINLFHIYDYGVKMNVFTFLNPKIGSLQLDNLDMAVGDQGNELRIKFAYDSVFVDTAVDMNSKEYNIESLDTSSVFPLRYNDGTAQPRYENLSSLVPEPSVADCGPQENTKSTGLPSMVSGGGFGGALYG